MKGMLLLLLARASSSIRFSSLHGFDPVLDLGEKGAYAKRRAAARSKASTKSKEEQSKTSRHRQSTKITKSRE